MKAIKCDRCKKYYDPYEPSEATLNSNKLIFAEGDSIGSYYEVRQFELCPECMREAVQFMQKKWTMVKE